MHIVYLTSEFVTEKWHGGLASYLNNIAAIMSEHGHEVTIITLSEQSGRISYSERVEVVRVQIKPVCSLVQMIGRNLISLFNSWKIYRVLEQEHKRHRVDIVQAANYGAVGFFRDKRIPTVVRTSSDSSLWRNARYFEFDYERALKEKKLEDHLELWCVKRADAAFAPSCFCASVIAQRSGSKVSVIESPYFNKKCEMDESIYQEKLCDKKYLLFNSSLSRLKGTHVGLLAAETLLVKYPDLYMVYAGYDYGLSQKDGSVQKISEIIRRQNEQYGGRVLYLGNISHEKLFPIVKHSMGCILPSRVDNLPNSCIESMALGSIVIGTYGASFEQLIKNKENGLLIKRDSAVSLIRAVDYLMNMSDDERLAMQKNAIDVIERLNPLNVYEQMANFYKKTIEDKYKRK